MTGENKGDELGLALSSDLRGQWKEKPELPAWLAVLSCPSCALSPTWEPSGALLAAGGDALLPGALQGEVSSKTLPPEKENLVYQKVASK